MNIVEISFNFSINFLSLIRKIASMIDLTQSQVLCIYAIPFNGISQSNLAKKLSIDISTLSRNLDRLIQLNLVYKQSSLIDKRSFKIMLTEKGDILYKKFNFIINDRLASSYNKLELNEQESLEEILNKLNWELELINK